MAELETENNKKGYNAMGRTKEQEKQIEQLLALIVTPTEIHTRPGEKCFFYSKAQLGTPYIETTTTSKPGIGIGFTIPITKHFGIGLSRHRVKTETSTQTVWEKKPCSLYVMGERIVILYNRREIDINFELVTDMVINRDAIKISYGSEDYYIFLNSVDMSRFRHMYELVVKAYQSGIDMAALFPDEPHTKTAYSSYTSDNEDSYVRSSGVKSLQGDYAKTIFLWSLSWKPAPVKKRDEYPSYLFYDCGIQNAPKYHKDLIENGYFEPTPIRESLSTMKVADLKELLQKNGISATGKKEKLIDAALNGISQEKLAKLFPSKTYVLSEKGRDFLKQHDDYVKLKEHPNYLISHEEFDKEKLACPAKSFNDVCWGIFNRRISENAKNQESSRNIYYNMFVLLKEEKRMIDALDKLLYVLYLDIGEEFDRELRSYKKGWISKKEFFENLETATFVAPGLAKEIGYLEDVFSLELIDRIYEFTSGVQYCPKALFVELISSIIEGEYNDEEFRVKLIREFRKVAKL